MTTVPLSPRHKLGIPAGESKLRWWRVLGDGDIPLVVNDRGKIVFFFGHSRHQICFRRIAPNYFRSDDQGKFTYSPRLS
jgi:hypothetical protein